MRVLITGCIGFLGSRLCDQLQMDGHTVVPTARRRNDWHIHRLDNSTLDRKTIKWMDLTENITGLCEDVDCVIHTAALSHVDHSIRNPRSFAMENIEATSNLLEEARLNKVKKFIYVSTDETYGGAAPDESHVETDHQQPSNPYSASKAACENLCWAYMKTYGLPVIITRAENTAGPYQLRKVLPVFTAAAMNDTPLPVYGQGLAVRQWIYVWDHVKALSMLASAGATGEIYNIGANHELSNLDMARTVLTILGKPLDMLRFIPDHEARPGHDQAYRIDSTKLREALGWSEDYSLDDTIEKTVLWYRDNPWWMK